MPDPPDELTVSSPGRICLFGEHQDYLGLPVIPAAISLRISIHAQLKGEPWMEIDLPDIGSHESFSALKPLPYRTERDYFRSAVNVLKRHGYTFARGLGCTVHSRIPINAGTSSSSALVVSWINVLTQMSDQALRLPAAVLAQYAHEAEVVEFGEPGGMMDHYSTAFGGVVFVSFHPQLSVEVLKVKLETFVLGDSREPKDTKAVLARSKMKVLDIVRQLSALDPSFSLEDLTDENVLRWKHRLGPEQFAVLQGSVRNHSITMRARRLLEQAPLDHRLIGEMLNDEQSILRDILNVSTPKIELMLESAMRAGAYGGKINGSGGGGCMFAYAPDHPDRVAEAIERTGGKAWIISVEEGTRNDSTQIE